MSIEIFKGARVLLFIFCSSAFAMENQKFETNVLPEVSVLPFGEAQQKISENRYAFIRYLQEQKSDTDSIPAALLLGLPGDVLCVILFWFCENKELAGAMVSYAKKESLGESLCLYALVMQAKGAPFMKIDESMKLAYTSPETYFLCKRLFPEFKKQIIEESNENGNPTIRHFITLDSERRSLTNDALFLDYNTDANNDEITLLKKYLPEEIKKVVGKYYVKPRKEIVQRLLTSLWLVPYASAAFLGYYILLPLKMAGYYSLTAVNGEWGDPPTLSYCIKETKQIVDAAWDTIAFKNLIFLELLLD